MKRKSVAYDHQIEKNLALLQNPGLLLTATKPSGESNTMTIGWGQIGFVWGRPVFTVLVRPSRYTYEFIEASGEFTVNVPTEAMRRWVGVCGTKSGRDMDKFGEFGMTITPGQTVDAATIDACPMVYECRVVHFNDLIPTNLDQEIDVKSYGGSDYHRLYFGEITGTFSSD